VIIHNHRHPACIRAFSSGADCTTVLDWRPVGTSRASDVRPVPQRFSGAFKQTEGRAGGPSARWRQSGELGGVQNCLARISIPYGGGTTFPVLGMEKHMMPTAGRRLTGIEPKPKLTAVLRFC
jgi:hypothetical protein